MARPKKSVAKTTSTYLNRIETELASNQSRLSMVLGALIVLVIGILVFNYFNRNKSDLGPAQNTSMTQTRDVTAANLPGKYTVKDGDTLFDIANKYYNDGYKFTEIAKANNLPDSNLIEKDQVLEIPKLDTTMAQPTTQPSMQPSATPGSDQPVMSVDPTDWGTKITGNTYTVVDGDWLSTIAGRAYGDIYAFQKIADANHIADPNLIEPGQVLTIPR